MGSGYRGDSPYPGPRDGDYVPYREFEQLARRVERIETKQIGESLVRIEERQQTQRDLQADMGRDIAEIKGDVADLKDAETKRVALKLGTKGLVAFIIGLVGLAGTIVGIVVALLGGGA
jgi:hypothetical protein